MPKALPGELPEVRRSPNHVSSLATDWLHRTAPLPLVGDPGTVMERLRAVVSSFPRAEIVEEAPGWLHATFTTRLIGFVDDVYLRQGPDRVDVWSGSRVGEGDLFANRIRVWRLRRRWAASGDARLG